MRCPYRDMMAVVITLVRLKPDTTTFQEPV